MKLSTFSMLAVASLGLVSSTGVINAQAKGGYHRTKTTKINASAFYSTSKHGATYRANGSLTNFKFKKNYELKHYRNSTWMATSKTYIKVHGKQRLYYYVHNSDSKAEGWVWRGYLKAGKHNQMRQESQNKTGNYVMAKPGKLYQFKRGANKKVDPMNVRFNRGLQLTDKVIYQRTQTWTIFKHGKASTYYYVTTTDNKTSGWVWHGFLKPESAATSAATTTTTNSSNSMTPNPEPVVPDPKPVVSAPAWTVDDGKRERLVVDMQDLEDWLRSGHSYDLGIYAAVNPEDGSQHGAYLQRIFVNDQGLRGIDQNGKEYRVSMDEPTLANGDTLALPEEDWFASLYAPEPSRQYPMAGWPDIYVSSAPHWEQYVPAQNIIKLWEFNLKTRLWERAGTLGTPNETPNSQFTPAPAKINLQH